VVRVVGSFACASGLTVGGSYPPPHQVQPCPLSSAIGWARASLEFAARSRHAVASGDINFILDFAQGIGTIEMSDHPQPPDRSWFITQVRLHQSHIRAAIRGLGVRAEAVDDMAQDAFVLAWEKLAEFGPGGDFGAWVIQIARRLVANERRKDARRSRLLAGDVTDLLLRLAPEPDAPAARAERDEEVAALRACLEQLPAHGREMIRLRYFEDLAPGAIAGRLGRPSDAVRQLLLRLRRALLECVEGRLGTELR